MEKIYLDVCSLCRPFDDQSYVRIRLESDSINLILSEVKEHRLLLMKSSVHYKEIGSINDDFERIELIKLLEWYGETSKYDPKVIRKRTEELINLNFGIADAAHVAFSEYYNSVFISCDDRLLKKCTKSIAKIKCMNPLIFCEMESLK